MKVKEHGVDAPRVKSSRPARPARVLPLRPGQSPAEPPLRVDPVTARVNAPGPQRLGDLVGRVLGRIIRRARRWRRQEDPQQALLERLTDDEVLSLLGPSWSAMTEDQRQRYPDGWTTADWIEVAARERQARTAEPAGQVPALVGL